MQFDAHVHSAASPDSEMPPQAAIAALQKQGLGCVFTEHVDEHPFGEKDFIADFSLYPHGYRQYRSKSVLLGLEIGLTEQCAAQNRQLAAAYDLDYILGSVHWVEKWDIFFPCYWEEVGGEAYSRYLAYVLKMVRQNDFFDALGHIDYISRYNRRQEKNALYASYAAEYDAIFRALLESGRLLELNTSRFGDREAEENLYALYRRYYEMGGRYITIGSDAHSLENVGRHYKAALEMAGEIGLKTAYFKERRRIT